MIGQDLASDKRGISGRPIEHASYALPLNQKTLKNRIRCSGVGLHSGVRVNMTLHPAAADTGVVFRRTDVSVKRQLIPARFDSVTDLTMSTTVGNRDGVSVGTIEHLLAAFAGCGVDNVLVELDGPEVPAMDGSAAPFVFLIECANTVEQAAARRYIEVLRKIEVRDGNRAATLSPADCFGVSFEIDFANAVVGEQSCHFALYNGTFKTELSRARTFGFVSEFEKLLSLGLARGGSLDNAVVVSGDRVLNEEGLRYDDEFVRHKALDSVGDLFLAGAPILGHFHGVRSGHALNNRLLRTLFAETGAWRYTSHPAAWNEIRTAANG
jgi:UDP-3-O-[3-hydroxymyristoyl] N-acetylglucosamine deacetylase